MSNLGRKPNVMPILDETNIEALLKLKATLEQSIESEEAKTNLGITLEKILKHWFFLLVFMLVSSDLQSL